MNPVAVMINKAMIEIPPRFAGLPPVNPDARVNSMRESFSKAKGLAEDVRYYGEWMKQEAFKRIGHLYPKVKVPKEQGGGEATVIAWIWARTVKCPNPACGCEMPLASSFVLTKKPGKEAYVVPEFDAIGKRICFFVRHGKGSIPDAPKIARGANFKCIRCGESTKGDYIKQEAMEGRMDAQLMAIVAEGLNGRIYISPNHEHEAMAMIKKPESYPNDALPYDPRNIWCVNYGLDTYDKLFTNRQLTALTTFSDLVLEVQKKVEANAAAAGMKNDPTPLAEGGAGAKAYGQAVGVYLTFAVDREADLCSSIASWINSIGAIRNTFARQAIPMVWDYAEANPFSNSSGCFANMLDWVTKCIENFPCGIQAKVRQFDAQSDIGLRNIMISTDPPYYDNIGYADLSDFFYVWMRRSLKDTYPKLFRTMLVPKVEELIATPYRFDGSVDRARDFFEGGMLKAFRQVNAYARDDIPVTIYYAFKQSETDEDEVEEGNQQVASTGWETMLSAIIKAGFAITGTWPMRTERAVRTIASGTNALASSIVLVCRKRPEDAPVITRGDFQRELRGELRRGLQKMQEGSIAPVDLAQASIGPGMAVYSKYSSVLEADGKPMSVRTALQIINRELDAYVSETEGDMDADSRFCVAWYEQNGLNEGKYGEAETLAQAKNANIQALVRDGVLFAQGGKVRLLGRGEIPGKWKARLEDTVWTATQHLTRALEGKDGEDGAARLLSQMNNAAMAENAKALAYRLFLLAEKKGLAQDALGYNDLVYSWDAIQRKAIDLRNSEPVQMSLEV